MWAWLWQRISALAILVFLGLHLTLTYKPFIQFLLLLAVIFHATLGLRIILLDFGVVGVKYQKALIGGLGVLGAVMRERGSLEYFATIHPVAARGILTALSLI
jgi:succinate dehydrogenase / fumarate reductase cytochrome b subunit